MRSTTAGTSKSTSLPSPAPTKDAVLRFGTEKTSGVTSGMPMTIWPYYYTALTLGAGPNLQERELRVWTTWEDICGRITSGTRAVMKKSCWRLNLITEPDRNWNRGHARTQQTLRYVKCCIPLVISAMVMVDVAGKLMPPNNLASSM